MGNFEGEGWPIVQYKDTLWLAVQKMAEPIEMPFGLCAPMSSRNHAFRWGAH